MVRRVAIGYSGMRSSAEEAQSVAVAQCRQAGGQYCQSIGVMNRGCAYITLGARRMESQRRRGKGVARMPVIRIFVRKANWRLRGLRSRQLTMAPSCAKKYHVLVDRDGKRGQASPRRWYEVSAA